MSCMPGSSCPTSNEETNQAPGHFEGSYQSGSAMLVDRSYSVT